MSVRIALVESTAALREQITAGLRGFFAGAVVESFDAIDHALPDSNYDWQRFDAIVVGVAGDEPATLSFARALTANAKRVPVIHLQDRSADSSSQSLLAQLASTFVARTPHAPDAFIAALISACEQGIRHPANPPEPTPMAVFGRDKSETTAALHTVIQARGALHVSIVDGSNGLRAILKSFIMLEWPDAEIEDIDPYSQTMRGGQLAHTAGGAILLLGAIGSLAEAKMAIAKLHERAMYPAIILLVPRDLARQEAELIAAGAVAVFPKDSLSHHALTGVIKRLVNRAAPIDAPTVYGQFSFTLGSETEHVQIAGYRAIRQLASGPLAKVFEAERLVDGLHAVVKILTASPIRSLDAVHDFCTRYPFFASQENGYIAPHLDAGIVGMWPYIAIEFLPHGDLKSRMTGPLVPAEACRLLFKLAIALSTLHARDIAHLDVKPENIFYRSGGDLVLIDFNISASFGSVPRTAFGGEVLGSPYYMSPEQAQAQAIDGRADLYSAGVIFFEMLTGEPPYAAKSHAEIIFRHINDEIPWLPLPLRPYQDIVDRLMAKHVNDRFASAAELALELKPFLIDTVDN